MELQNHRPHILGILDLLYTHFPRFFHCKNCLGPFFFALAQYMFDAVDALNAVNAPDAVNTLVTVRSMQSMH